MTRKATEEARKVRWTVPGADVSVIEWLDEQENVSQSLRLLIREAIQRDGYIDVAYKPVDQLPRRGRPPAEASEQSARPPHSEHGAQSDKEQREPGHSSHQNSGDSSHWDSVDRVETSAPQEPGEAASSASGDADSTGGPMDMEAIFDNRR